MGRLAVPKPPVLAETAAAGMVVIPERDQTELSIRAVAVAVAMLEMMAAMAVPAW